MNSEAESKLAELIEKRLGETISEDEAKELETRLLESKAARHLFLELSTQHAQLQMLGDSLTMEELQASHARRFPSWAWAAAAALVLGCFLWLQDSAPDTVATLVSNENAAWESSLPTTPGSELIPGLLELKAGVATIRFHSGAVVVLEAPARLELQTPMRSRLLAGAAVIDVPEPAIGFIMETPAGYAVDHGTQFAVTVNQESTEASFSVISGEISVHHPGSGTELRMLEDQSSTATRKGVKLDSELAAKSALKRARQQQRVRTLGQSTSIVRNDNREMLHPDLLMAKTATGHAEFDRRSVFAFKIAKLDFKAATSARIRFYIVPSGLGYAAYLPKKNRFAVYGVTNELAENFAIDCDWKDAPALTNAMKLGTFEIPRSRQRGVIWFKSPAILDFVKADTNGSVTLILTRETLETHRHGLVHAFASDSHPEGNGPVLELTFGDAPLVLQADASQK
jgi:ferric-dicitrate binding protein FerR (iron transport regulator)